MFDGSYPPGADGWMLDDYPDPAEPPRSCENCMYYEERTCGMICGVLEAEYDETPFIPIRQTITIGFITPEDEMLPVDCEEDDIKRDLQKMIGCALQARQARFEHGERR